MGSTTLTLALAAALLGAEPAGASRETSQLTPLSPDHLQVTEAKTEALSSEMAMLEAAGALLEGLGKATEKRKGESPRQYLTRVNKIMKAEALLIHLAHERVEQALDAKYQLQEAVREYARWVEQMSLRIRERPDRYRSQVDELVEEIRDLRLDGQVLAHLIATRGSFSESVKKRYEKEFPPGGVDAISDGASRQQKFLAMPEQQWPEEFRRLVREIQVREAKRQFLAARAIPESEELASLLPAEHHKMVEEATELLERHTDLETTADKVAIAAEYAMDNLELVSPFIDDLPEEEILRRSLEAERLAERLEGGLGGVVPSGIAVPPPTGIMLGEGEATPLSGPSEEAGSGASAR